MNPVLYILVRTELDSMTPGRVAAQVSHASNQFTHELNINSHKLNNKLITMYTTWKLQANGFGTAIVLDGIGRFTIDGVIDMLKDDITFTGLVIDPEYHVSDGASTHLVPNVLTCGYVFIDKDVVDNTISHQLKAFKLYNGDKNYDEPITPRMLHCSCKMGCCNSSKRMEYTQHGGRARMFGMD